MIALAVLLLVLVAAIVLFVIVTGATETVRLAWDELNIEWEPSALLVFLLGALALLLVGVAIALFRAGTKRSMQRRRELKRLRESDAERARAERAHAEQDRAERARAVPPAEPGRDDQRGHDGRDAGRDRHETAHDRPVSPPPRDQRSGATPGDPSWYDDAPPERR